MKSSLCPKVLPPKLWKKIDHSKALNQNTYSISNSKVYDPNVLSIERKGNFILE